MTTNTTALALAAGGARGAYQAGALLYLAEQGVSFTAVAGSSVGTLNGAYYAQGDGSVGHLGLLCELWRKVPDAGLVRVDRAAAAEALALTLFRGKIGGAQTVAQVLFGFQAILDPMPLSRLLDRWLDYAEVCRSPTNMTVTVLPETVPLLDVLIGPWRGATYLRARELGPAGLRPALLAATAIPFAFPSCLVEGRAAADAGLADPLPARVLYEAGARRIFSVFLCDDTVQSREDFPGCPLFQVRPSVPINTGFASTFDFSVETIDRLIELGYQDALASYEEARALFDAQMRLQAGGDRLQRLAELLPAGPRSVSDEPQ